MQNVNETDSLKPSDCKGSLVYIAAMFFFQHLSFEVMRLSITLTSGNISFIYLHRPPPCRNNQLTDSCFLSKFSFLLDVLRCNSLSSNIIINGDLNVHFDIPTDPLVPKTNSLLDRDSFYQAVTVPTHKLGHILDIAIFRPTDGIVCLTTVTQLPSSDNHSVVCDLSTIRPVYYAEPKQSRNLRGIDLDAFKVNI